jgi:hypothetical protein
MGAILAAGPTVGTRHLTPMRHIIMVTPRIAEAAASTFTLHRQTTAIDTADPDIFIIDIAAGILSRCNGPLNGNNPKAFRSGE